MSEAYNIQKAQARLLDIATVTANILEKHQIPYMIAFGTLLGAVRHGGFIPWDDDFDFFLFDDSYDEAVNVLRQNLPADLFIEDGETEPNFFHGWARVKDYNSICKYAQFPQDAAYKHQGICVDLLRITKIPEKDYADFRYNESLAYLERRKKFGLITSEDYAVRQKTYLAEKAKYTHWNTDQPMWAFPYENGRHNIEDVLPLKRYKFEDRSFLGPHNAENILTMIYGDYRQLPPVESRHPHYSDVIYSQQSDDSQQSTKP